MKYAKLVDGRPVWAPSVVEKEGYTTANPRAARLRAAGYREVVYPEGPAPENTRAVYEDAGECIRVSYEPLPAVVVGYEARVEALIRERYTVSDELAILRQRDTKPAEFDVYNAFCEACKRRAKELGDNG